MMLLNRLEAHVHTWLTLTFVAGARLLTVGIAQIVKRPWNNGILRAYPACRVHDLWFQSGVCACPAVCPGTNEKRGRAARLEVF